MGIHPTEEKLSVFSPTGSDRHQKFGDFAGEVNDSIHAPINYHAYAACQGTCFHKDLSTIHERENILFLLGSHSRENLRFVKKLRSTDRIVVTAFKETGLHQILPKITCTGTLGRLREIFSLSHGCISPTENVVPIYRSLGAPSVEFIPTPYPIEDFRWDFSIPVRERKGIFVGTREFYGYSRNHLFTLLLSKMIADETGESVTVINNDAFRGKRLLRAIGFGDRQLRIISGCLPYSLYMKEMASHKFVFQLDNSMVPGQVAGDALLCRIPCVGGNGTIESLVFPELVSKTANYESLIRMAVNLCNRIDLQMDYVRDALERASAFFSFKAGSQKIGHFLKTLREKHA